MLKVLLLSVPYLLRKLSPKPYYITKYTNIVIVSLRARLPAVIVSPPPPSLPYSNSNNNSSSSFYYSNSNSTKAS